MRRKIVRIATVAITSGILGLGVLINPAAAAVQKTFVGYGYLPSDAHSAAVAQMHAYSSSCVEVGTTYSEAGSEHYWQATLTANC